MSSRFLVNRIALALFFIAIFVISIPHVWDPDIFFHVKSGQVISQQGIIHHDVFSYNTTGREWFPYEWLFQVLVYYFQNLFGFEAIKYLVAFVATIQSFLIYLILRKVFNLNLWMALILTFFFFASVHEFISPRPHLFAYTFLISEIFLILLYYFKSKNLLWITLPITLAWSNLHGSMFLSVALFAGYSVVSLINFKLLKERIWWAKFKMFGLFAILSAVLTILPPLFLTQYRLLWMFFQNRDLVTKFIDEWAPIIYNLNALIIFSTTLAIVVSIFAFTIVKKKAIKQALWFLPLSFFPLASYLASRNIVISYTALTLMLGWSFSYLKFKNLNALSKRVLISFLVIFLVVYCYLFSLKLQEEANLQLYYPDQAATFIKNNHLQGHMFNEYVHGGYLLYRLYPQQQVFFDGRTDLYLCCEMPYSTNLSLKKNLSDDQYKAVVDDLWNKYNISFALVRTEKHILLRKIGRVLQEDPDWSLVYWDDNSQIFVRKDGQNDNIISQFEAKSATPYDKNPFRKDQQEEAMAEYQKMIKIADSAKSRNAIGYIDLLDKKYDQAKIEFDKAVAINPLNESPYMNLAELAVMGGDIDQAIKLYQKAKELAPDRGLVYIRLGQLTLQNGGSQVEAKKIWQEGIKYTVDDEARNQLLKLLAT